MRSPDARRNAIGIDGITTRWCRSAGRVTALKPAAGLARFPEGAR